MKDDGKIVAGFAVIAGIVGVFAVLQFLRPADDAFNSYALQDGEQTLEVATVAATGRARVSSTFAFISGFTDFVVLMPPLLLCISLNATGRNRWLGLAGAAVTAAVAPTGGSRAPMVAGAVALLAVAFGAGFFATRTGRRVLFGGVVLAVVTIFAMPEAIRGVGSRFTSDTEETEGRFLGALDILPPVSLLRHTYEPFGYGTGMEQNARMQFGVVPFPTDSEAEQPRILKEEGPIGYMLVWAARFGLFVALLRASARFNVARQGTYRGLCIAYAIVLNIGYFVTDHVWTALFFVGAGLLLRAAAACPPLPVAAPGGRRAAPARLLARRGP